MSISCTVCDILSLLVRLDIVHPNWLAAYSNKMINDKTILRPCSICLGKKDLIMPLYCAHENC